MFRSELVKLYAENFHKAQACIDAYPEAARACVRNDEAWAWVSKAIGPVIHTLVSSEDALRRHLAEHGMV